MQRVNPDDIVINLVTNAPGMAQAWREAFEGEQESVHVYYQDFIDFMRVHPEIDCVVSPANSYGLMDGGFDLAITVWFGDALQEAVRAHILEHFCGEQPVATSFAIDVPGFEGVKLIHTPTMRVPTEILDPMVVYQCMRTSLIAIAESGCKNVVIPAFGGLCGALPYEKIAQLMHEGFMQVCNPPSELNWAYADSRDLEGEYRKQPSR